MFENLSPQAEAGHNSEPVQKMFLQTTAPDTIVDHHNKHIIYLGSILFLKKLKIFEKKNIQKKTN